MYGEDLLDETKQGIIPRAINEIFMFINADENRDIKFELKFSMLEIYQEQLFDLLNPDLKSSDLKIKEHRKKGIYVENLSEVYISSEEEFLYLIHEAERCRIVKETGLNKCSSRSHLLFQLQITQKFPDDTERRGLLNLIDLAGSEKVSKTHAIGETLNEAKKINSSLSTLGKVISILAANNGEYVPYRESKLTRILQDSLGGNSKTILIVNCSTHSYNADESIYTLNFAKRAKKIKNKVKINIKHSVEQLEGIIELLTHKLKLANEEIRRLKSNRLESPQRESAAADLFALPNDENFNINNINNNYMTPHSNNLRELNRNNTNNLNKEINYNRSSSNEIVNSQYDTKSAKAHLNNGITSNDKNLIIDNNRNASIETNSNINNMNLHLKSLENSLIKNFANLNKFDLNGNLNEIESDALKRKDEEIQLLTEKIESLQQENKATQEKLDSFANQTNIEKYIESLHETLQQSLEQLKEIYLTNKKDEFENINNRMKEMEKFYFNLERNYATIFRNITDFNQFDFDKKLNMILTDNFADLLLLNNANTSHGISSLANSNLNVNINHFNNFNNITVHNADSGPLSFRKANGTPAIATNTVSNNKNNANIDNNHINNITGSKDNKQILPSPSNKSSNTNLSLNKKALPIKRSGASPTRLMSEKYNEINKKLSFEEPESLNTKSTMQAALNNSHAGAKATVLSKNGSNLTSGEKTVNYRAMFQKNKIIRHPDNIAVVPGAPSTQNFIKPEIPRNTTNNAEYMTHNSTINKKNNHNLSNKISNNISEVLKKEIIKNSANKQRNKPYTDKPSEFNTPSKKQETENSIRSSYNTNNDTIQNTNQTKQQQLQQNLPISKRFEIPALELNNSKVFNNIQNANENYNENDFNNEFYNPNITNEGLTNNKDKSNKINEMLKQSHSLPEFGGNIYQFNLHCEQLFKKIEYQFNSKLNLTNSEIIILSYKNIFNSNKIFSLKIFDEFLKSKQNYKADIGNNIQPKSFESLLAKYGVSNNPSVVNDNNINNINSNNNYIYNTAESKSPPDVEDFLASSQSNIVIGNSNTNNLNNNNAFNNVTMSQNNFTIKDEYLFSPKSHLTLSKTDRKSANYIKDFERSEIHLNENILFSNKLSSLNNSNNFHQYNAFNANSQSNNKNLNNTQSKKACHEDYFRSQYFSCNNPNTNPNTNKNSSCNICKNQSDFDYFLKMKACIIKLMLKTIYYENLNHNLISKLAVDLSIKFIHN